VLTDLLTQFHHMAGHNKWSKVKRIKGALDQKRGKLFSKLAKEITVSAKLGGGDPGGNPRLRSAILAARTQSMPNENIERAIKRGTGEGAEAANYEELVYEGYAPGGVAVLIEAATDNKNRTAADLRLIFSKNHGHLGSSGSVAYMFKRRGQITVPLHSMDEDEFLQLALEAGAQDVNSDEEHHVIITAHDQLYAVAEALKAAGVVADSQKLTYIPETTIQIVDECNATRIVRLCEALEDSDDVQSVHANFDVHEEVLARISG
jgi:YebC/PmpR family DNA-binding regulatory protein